MGRNSWDKCKLSLLKVVSIGFFLSCLLFIKDRPLSIDLSKFFDFLIISNKSVISTSALAEEVSLTKNETLENSFPITSFVIPPEIYSKVSTARTRTLASLTSPSKIENDCPGCSSGYVSREAGATYNSSGNGRIKFRPIIFIAEEFHSYDTLFSSSVSARMADSLNWYRGQLSGFSFTSEPPLAINDTFSINDCEQAGTGAENCRLELKNRALSVTRPDTTAVYAIFVPGTLNDAYFEGDTVFFGGNYVPGSESEALVNQLHGLSQAEQAFIISHEFGHAMGLTHSYFPSIMSGYEEGESAVLLDNDNFPEKYTVCMSDLNTGSKNCSVYAEPAINSKIVNLNGRLRCNNYGEISLPGHQVSIDVLTCYDPENCNPPSFSKEVAINGYYRYVPFNINHDFDVSGLLYRFFVTHPDSPFMTYNSTYIFVDRGSSTDICTEYGRLGDCVDANSGQFELLLPDDVCAQGDPSNPTLSLTSDKTNLLVGESTNIRWDSTNTVSCHSYGNYWRNEERGISGSTNTGVFTTAGSYAYDMICTSADEISVSGYVRIEVTAPPIQQDAISGLVSCQFSGSPDQVSGVYAEMYDSITGVSTEIAFSSVDHQSGRYSLSPLNPAYSFKTVAQNPNLSYAIRPGKTSESQGVCIACSTIENGQFNDANNDGVIDQLCSRDRGCEPTDDSDGIQFGFLNCDRACVVNPQNQCTADAGQNWFNMGTAPTATKVTGTDGLDYLKLCFSGNGGEPHTLGFLIYKDRDIQLDDTGAARNPDFVTGRYPYDSTNPNHPFVCTQVGPSTTGRPAPYTNSILMSSLTSGTHTFKAFPDISSGASRQKDTCRKEVSYRVVGCSQARVINAAASIVSQGTGQVPSGSVILNWSYDTISPNIRPDSFLIQRFKKQGTMEQSVASVPSSSQTDYSYTDVFSQHSDVANSSDLFYLIWPIVNSNEDLYPSCTYLPETFTPYTPAAQTNAQPTFQPQGAFEAVNNATCSITGWTRDQDDPTESTDVHVYADGPYGEGGTFIVGQAANAQRTQAPAGNYQFNINFTQGSVIDGRQHSLYVYAINLPNTPGWSQFIGTKNINCQASGASAAAVAGTKKTCESCTAGGECASGNCASGKCASIPCAVGSICVPNPICSETFEELLDKIAGFIFWVAIILAPIMIIIGAFIILTAAGDPEKIKKAMKIFLYTAIGVILVFTARALASVIEGIFK